MSIDVAVGGALIEKSLEATKAYWRIWPPLITISPVRGNMKWSGGK